MRPQLAAQCETECAVCGISVPMSLRLPLPVERITCACGELVFVRMRFDFVGWLTSKAVSTRLGLGVLEHAPPVAVSRS